MQNSISFVKNLMLRELKQIDYLELALYIHIIKTAERERQRRQFAPGPQGSGGHIN